jgi:hypothetical protein
VRRENSGESRGQKRAHPNSSEGSAGAPQYEEIEANEGGLRAWGYMPGHVHWKVGAIDVVGECRGQYNDPELTGQQDTQRKPSLSEPAGVDVVERVLHAVPPRSITGEEP